MTAPRTTIPATLMQPRAWVFWSGIVLTGIGTGLAAATLSLLLRWVQHTAWPGGATLVDAAAQLAPVHHILVLSGAGMLTGLGQFLLVRLSSGNGIEITEAIWFTAGRMPRLRTLGSAVLSVVIVGMGVSLGREGAPKQSGAIIANVVADHASFTDEQRRLLVACGAGAGLAAAYGVPVGGALFALEVMRGVLALRYVLPALLASLLATAVSWLAIPNAPTYFVPEAQISGSLMVWALLAGPLAGLVSVMYVRLLTFADRRRPQGWLRLITPMLAFLIIGALSVAFPQILGNGKDIVQLTLSAELAPTLLLALLALKPAATILSIGSGAPGGLFTPTLSLGALFGGALGAAWSVLFPGTPLGTYALIGGAAILAAATQGPISAVVLVMELTGHARMTIVPMIMAVVLATLVSRSIEPRSVYDARLNDAELKQRQKLRDH